MDLRGEEGVKVAGCELQWREVWCVGGYMSSAMYAGGVRVGRWELSDLYEGVV